MDCLNLKKHLGNFSLLIVWVLSLIKLESLDSVVLVEIWLELLEPFWFLVNLVEIFGLENGYAPDSCSVIDTGSRSKVVLF